MLRAWGERVGGTLVPGRCLVAARSVHVDDCLVLDPGCNRKRAIVPLLDLADMRKSP